jgi:hypothetical protein
MRESRTKRERWYRDFADSGPRLCATSFSVSLKSEQRASNGEQQHALCPTRTGTGRSFMLMK